MTANTLTPQMLTGRSTDHLAVLSGNHRLQPQAVAAFQAKPLRGRGSIYSLPALFAILTAN